ncbi:MAG TPA: hypothetical protein VD993_18565 [Chitinophagaceae bacterium]|nr:hypothetical protein [Chitinophagaceae bacterium]
MRALMFFFLFVIAVTAKAQSSPATLVADKIAQKMKDSLNLNDVQKLLIYQINLQLHEAKMLKRQLYAGTDSLGIHVQRVENTRDSLYRTVLNEEKYLLYKEKKRVLVSNN